MIIAQGKSKLDGSISLFDVQTQSTLNNRMDLVLNPMGQLNRVIGIDKLATHVVKYILVLKGTYSDPLIGTNVSNPVAVGKSEFSLKSDIVVSLTEYSALQSANSFVDTTILGYNIYRTRTPDQSTSWKKINKYLIANNFYYDGNLNVNATYYYSLTRVKNIAGSPVESGIGNNIGVIIPSTDTMDAVVTNDFIVVPERKSVTLYWKVGVFYQNEEVLRSIAQVLTWFDAGDPRSLNIYLELTNLDKQVVTAQVQA